MRDTEHRGEVPRVSVIMPFLNAGPFIGEAISSVIAQMYASWELLLVDDGSSDASASVAARYAAEHPDRIRVLAHEGRENRGASAARNLGIRRARGEYLALLDADDVWLPHKLAEQVPLLDAHPEVGTLYGDTLFWYSWTGEAADSRRDYMAPLGVARDTVIPPPVVLERMLQGRAAAPCTCSVLMRRSLVEQVAGFEEQFHCMYDDQVLYAKLFLRAPVYAAAACWDRYRRHPASTCWVADEAGRTRFERARFLEWLAPYVELQATSNVRLARIIRTELRMLRSPRYASLVRLGRRVERILEVRAGAPR